MVRSSRFRVSRLKEKPGSSEGNDHPACEGREGIHGLRRWTGALRRKAQRVLVRKKHAPILLFDENLGAEKKA